MTADPAEASVVAYLEMRSPQQLRPKHSDDLRFAVRELPVTDWRFNREMYLAVGEEWRWTDKRQWSENQWRQYAARPELRTFAAFFDDVLAGYYELGRDSDGGVEIEYFGLLPKFIGRGLGGALLTNAIETAWQSIPPPMRVWVHTCNRDHPQAIANYVARGMVVYKVTDREE